MLWIRELLIQSKTIKESMMMMKIMMMKTLKLDQTRETPKGKASSKGSTNGKSAFAKEPVEEPTAEVVMDDASEDVVRDDDQPQDTFEPKTTKTLNLKWFTQPPRPPTPDPKWSKRQVILGQPEQPWFNQMVSATKDPLTFNDLMNTLIDFSKSQLNKFSKPNVYSTKKILGVKSVSVKKLHVYGHLEEIVVKRADRQLYKFKEGVKSVSVKKLHVYGHLEEIVVKRAGRQLYKFKEGDFVVLQMNDIEDILLLDVDTSYSISLTVILLTLLVLFTFLEIEFKELHTPSHKPPGVIYKDLVKQKRVMRADELYKLSDRTLKKVRDELHHRVPDFDLGYKKEMSRRKWTATDKKWSKHMVKLIDKQMG
nr:hypothetical protein [Tanacetum cinerariifolium]